MKKLHKKVGAMALAGMVVAGGCFAGGSKAFADGGDEALIRKEQKKHEQKYKSNIYPQLPDSEYFKKGESSLGASEHDVQKLYSDIIGSGFYGIRLAGNKNEIDLFLKYLDLPQLAESKGYFINLDEFKEYMKEQKDNIQKGFYRFEIGGVKGIFEFRKDDVKDWWYNK